MREQKLHEAEKERRRLSCPRFRLSGDVAPRERDRERARLYWRASFEAGVCDAAHERFEKAQLFETELSEMRI